MLYDTPYDDRIAALSAELDATRIYYGDKTQMAAAETRKREADAIYESAAPAAVAKRTIFKRQWCRIEKLFRLPGTGGGTSPPAGSTWLPSKRSPCRINLQAMRPKERQAYVAQKAAERQALQDRIATLGQQRQAFIEAKVREEGGGEKSLDAQLYRCIKTQAADKAIRYTGGPAY